MRAGFATAAAGVLLTCVVPAARAASTEKPGEINNVFVQISRKLIPSVVNIQTTSTVKLPWSNRGGGGEGSSDDLWRRFFEEYFGEPLGGPPGQGMPAPKAQSLGSGFVLESSAGGGLILTNQHVIDGADEVKVKFTEADEEKESDAQVIGEDPDLDIAILKVSTKRRLQAVALADSDKLEVGEWIAAVGNPFGHGHSVSHGIVSAKERVLPGGFGKYLQVDAPINPGNSGGPLVNLNGEVVGINNAIDERGPGIGFAIPINAVKNVLSQLKSKGKVERGYIGVNVHDLRPDLAKSLKLDEGLKAPIITNVVPGDPAAKAGLQAYDVILEANGAAVRSGTDLVEAISSVPVGQKVRLKALRSGKELVFTITVARRPDARFAKNGGKGGKPGKARKAKRIDVGMELEEIDADVARDIGLPDDFKGVVVSRVAAGGPAFDAGLARGDVILEADHKPVKTIDQFFKVVSEKRNYLLRVRKQDETEKETFAIVTLKLAAEPGDE